MARSLRIAHVVRRYAPMRGGTERYVHDLAVHQARAGHRVTVVTLDRDVIQAVPGRLPTRELTEGVSVIRLPGLGGARYAMTWRVDRFVRILSRADVIHLHDLRFGFGTGVVTGMALRTPVVVHSHGFIFHTPWAARFKRAVIRAVVGPLLRVSKATVVASSTPDAEKLVSLAAYLRPQVRVYENAVDLTRFRTVRRAPDPNSVIAFGRVAPSKGLDRLIRAVAAIEARDVSLTVAGASEGDERQRLEELASRLRVGHRVSFVGSYSDQDLQKLLGRASLAIFPSRGEGFGIAVLEAMAAGVPVLVSDIPAHAALIGTELQHRLVGFDDPRAAAKAIAVALNDVAGSTRDARVARERAERFSIPRLGNEIAALYGDLGLYR